MNVFAQLFNFSSAYAYNSDSFAYIDCKLLKDVGSLKINHIVPEIIVNFKTSKIKLNVDGVIVSMPFDITWASEKIQVKESDASDSDFDCNEDRGSDSDDDDSDDDESQEEDSD